MKTGTSNRNSGARFETPPNTETDQMKKLTLLAALALFCLATLAGQPCAAARHTLRMHVNQPVADTSYHYIYALQLAEKITDRTQGEVKFDIYPGAQLGPDPQVLQQVAAGAIQTASLPFPNMVNIYEPLNVFTLPFLFNDFRAASRALNGPTAAKLYQDFEKTSGVKILAVYNGGARGITNSKKPINTVADFAGLKIRVPFNPILVEMVKSFGANATTMDGNEVFTALQQRAVDGQESAIAWSYDQGYGEVQKYLTITNHGFTPTCFVINAAYFYSLPEDTQKKLTEAAKEAAIYVDGFCEMYDLAVIDKYRAAGLEVTRVSPEELRPRVKDIWAKMAEKIGGMDIINALIKDGESKLK